MNYIKSKKAAQAAVQKALKQGVIIKLPCYKCGNEESVAHHGDYNKPFHVKFLCYSHHTRWHKKWSAKLPNSKIAKLDHFGMYALGMSQLGLKEIDECLNCTAPFLRRSLPVPYCDQCIKASEF